MNINVPVRASQLVQGGAAAAQGQKMTEVLMEYIESYVDKHGYTAQNKGGANETRRDLLTSFDV